MAGFIKDFGWFEGFLGRAWRSFFMTMQYGKVTWHIPLPVSKLTGKPFVADKHGIGELLDSMDKNGQAFMVPLKHKATLRKQLQWFHANTNKLFQMKTMKHYVIVWYVGIIKK